MSLNTQNRIHTQLTCEARVFFEKLGLLEKLKSKSMPYINFDTKLQIFHPSSVVEKIDFPVKPQNPSDRLAIRRHTLLELLVEEIRLYNEECSAQQAPKN